MGMDVYGRNPSSEEGEYFRASVWTWGPIYSFICEQCGDLLSDEELNGIGWVSTTALAPKTPRRALRRPAGLTPRCCNYANDAIANTHRMQSHTIPRICQKNAQTRMPR